MAKFIDSYPKFGKVYTMICCKEFFTKLSHFLTSIWLWNLAFTNGFSYHNECNKNVINKYEMILLDCTVKNFALWRDGWLHIESYPLKKRVLLWTSVFARPEFYIYSLIKYGSYINYSLMKYVANVNYSLIKYYKCMENA